MFGFLPALAFITVLVTTLKTSQFLSKKKIQNLEIFNAPNHDSLLTYIANLTFCSLIHIYYQIQMIKSRFAQNVFVRFCDFD